MRWLAAILLAGCAPAYQWFGPGTASQSVEWVVVPRGAIPHVCVQYAKPNIAACAVQIYSTSTCYVFSYMTEEEAKRMRDLDGVSIWEHEMRHCEGWRH